MLRIIFYCLVLAIITVNGWTSPQIVIYSSEKGNGEIQIVTDKTRYQVLHPNATLQKMIKSNGVKQQKKYEFGKRITGDKLLVEKTDEQSFPSAKDVQVLIRYPDSGEAETITYVYVLVDQSSNVGEGYVVEGGVEKKFIQILLEANQTIHFSYSASFYGY